MEERKQWMDKGNQQKDEKKSKSAQRWLSSVICAETKEGQSWSSPKRSVPKYQHNSENSTVDLMLNLKRSTFHTEVENVVGENAAVYARRNEIYMQCKDLEKVTSKFALPYKNNSSWRNFRRGLLWPYKKSTTVATWSQYDYQWRLRINSWRLEKFELNG